MTTRTLFPATLLAALSSLLLGCASEDAVARWTTAVDTLPNGALHVINTPPPEPEPTWTIEEELRIGSLDGGGPASFAEIKGLAVLDDGRIAVLDSQAQEVRVFGPDGEHLATHGGKGGGPEEFEGAFGLMLDPEGRLWVPDYVNARMSVLDPEEGHLESLPVTFLSRGWVWRGVMGRDGRIFKPSVTLGPPLRDVFRIWGRDMALLDSLPVPQPPDVSPGDQPWSFFWESSGGARAFFGVPFYPREVKAIDPDGKIWSTALGDPAYRIKRWTPGGDTALVLETRRNPVPVSPEERDSAIAALRERLGNLSDAATRQDWSKIPEVRPAVVSLYLADEGNLWARVSSPRQGETFDVYDPGGRYLGTAVASHSIFPWVAPVIRGDRFWAVVTDELDVPYVVRGRLVPVGAERS